MSVLNRTPIPRASSNAYLEVNSTPNNRWIVILVDGNRRTSIRIYRWWWQVQLLLWRNSDMPLIRKGRAAQRRTWGNVDSGMR